jgi:hypothetical protein
MDKKSIKKAGVKPNTRKSKERGVIDSAGALATLILNQETGDILPFIINGEIYGRIRLDDNIVEYSLFRDIDLFVRDVIVEVGYIDRKEDGWKFIGFGYKGGH